MTKKLLQENPKEEVEYLNNICETCQNDHKSVSQNAILTGFKICESCRISKTIFPI